MAQRQLEMSCQRFRAELDDEDDQQIRATSLEEVYAAIAETERELAARRSLRNLERLSPYINAIVHYGTVIEVFCNSSAVVPYLWGPLKLVILAVKEQTGALDQLLNAYAQIGNALPRQIALQESLKDNHDFQLLFAYLHEDITDFHRKVYQLIRKPAWKMFFSSAWGRFESQFSAIIANITKTSDLIDKQAMTFHILEVKEWRRKSLDDSITQEKRWAAEQLQAVLGTWLGTEVQDQKLKLDFLRSRSHEGTSSWITTHTRFRDWMRWDYGKQALWVHGKPGSGKSVLMSQIISFIDACPDKTVLYFFCDYHTPAYQVTARILKTYLAQCISQNPDVVPFLHDEYFAKGRLPDTRVLKNALVDVLKSMHFIRLIVDGLDEVQASEHHQILRDLMQLTGTCGDTCKLLVASQDLPTIRPTLSRAPYIFLGDESKAIERDMGVVVDTSLTDLDEKLGGRLGEAQRASLRKLILSKAEGMFLWVNLVLALLGNSCSLRDLKSNVDALPKKLEDMYEKLLNNIRVRSGTDQNMSRISRIFEWLLFAERPGGIQKYEVLLGSSIHEDCDILDRESRPLPNALDICKPLIEDGPGGTIALIHSTLPFFLLNPRNTLSISEALAHEHIAFACVSHLIQVLHFSEELDMSEIVGLGCLGLQQYANEYWITHILKYINLADAQLNAEIPLVRQLLRLATRKPSLPPSCQLNPQIKSHVEYVATDPTTMRSLQRLQDFPKVHEMIVKVLSFQKDFSAQQALQGPEVRAIEWDTSALSIADWKYHNVVKDLLRTSSHWRLSPEELNEFKAQFGATAFVCPVRSCQSGRGFPSEIELKRHKAQRHSPRLKCDQCSHNNMGFANEGSLQQHVRTMHNRATPQIPRALTRKRKTEDVGIAEMNTGVDAAPHISMSNSNQGSSIRKKIVFMRGNEVAFRPKTSSGTEYQDWYLGRVTGVIGKGGSRRYIVKDEDPDVPDSDRKEYKMSSSDMILIPPPPIGILLPDIEEVRPLEKGTTVLALYPDSTTFYKAYVTGMDFETGSVYLRFEGEDQDGIQQVVDRRYVVEY